jgi:hypothetical protein
VPCDQTVVLDAWIVVLCAPIHVPGDQILVPDDQILVPDDQILVPDDQSAVLCNQLGALGVPSVVWCARGVDGTSPVPLQPRRIVSPGHERGTVGCSRHSIPYLLIPLDPDSLTTFFCRTGINGRSGHTAL